MKTARVLVLGMLLGSAAAADAQEQDVLFFHAEQAFDAAQEPGLLATRPLMVERTVDVMMSAPFETGDPVLGAPYSADVTTEIVQVLADGNRIERRSTASVARDSQGRVRRTQQLAAIGPLLPLTGTETVTINDPVARTHYFLDAARKVAIQSPPMFTKRVPGPEASLSAPAFPAAPARESRDETLGTREFEGVSAEGTRSVVTIAAGTIGNQAPIEIVSERWYSPELQTVVYSRRSDPRFGETTFRLENIVRAEPSPDLFQVPSDYTVESGPPFGAGVRMERRIKR